MQKVSVKQDSVGAEEDSMCQNVYHTHDNPHPFFQLVSAKQDRLSAYGDWYHWSKVYDDAFM